MARSRAASAGSGVVGVVAVLATIVMLPVAMLFVVVWLSGWQLGFVQTGSMAPTIPTGSMIVSSPATADQVEDGMVLQFVDPLDERRMITHRVVATNRDDAGNLSFVTKGDANAERDSAEVPAENVRARVRWHVGGLGSLLWALRWPRSLLFSVVPLALVVLGAVLGRRPAGSDDERRGGEGPALVAPRPCGSCRTLIDAVDRYCRRCGRRQPRSVTGQPDVGEPHTDRPAGHPRRDRVGASVPS